jgi:hypothetical protein
MLLLDILLDGDFLERLGVAVFKVLFKEGRQVGAIDPPRKRVSRYETVKSSRRAAVGLPVIGFVLHSGVLPASVRHL